MTTAGTPTSAAVPSYADQELSILTQIGAILSSTLQLREAFGKVMQIISDKLNMHRGTLVLLDESTGRLRTEAAIGLGQDEIERAKYAVGEGITGNVVATGRPRIIRDLRIEPDFLNRTGRLGYAESDQAVSYICVPIKIENRTAGALAIDKPYENDDQLRGDHTFLDIIAAFLAQAIQIHRMVMRQKEELLEENAQLRAQVRDRYRFENIIGDSPAMHDVFATVGHHPMQVAVGGANDANVDFDRVCVADALELALLEHAQQLHLHRRAHCAHFIEKQSALVRLLEPALTRADRARKRPTHMAEELGLEKRFGDRSAIERDETLRPARAVVMNRPRDHFLTSTGFAGHENGAAGRRHRFEQLKQLAHRRAAADEPFEPIALLQLRPQVRIFCLQPALLERRAQGVQQLVELKRLGDEIGGAALDGFDGILHRAVPGDDDADDIGVADERRLEHARTVDARQPQVGNDDVEREFGELFERLLAGVGLFDVESVLGQPFRQGLAQGRFVFDEEEMFSGFRHPRGVKILTHKPVKRNSGMRDWGLAVTGRDKPYRVVNTAPIGSSRRTRTWTKDRRSRS
jgi:putative methionine-R-sulfoxide reductase with GAF domain